MHVASLQNDTSHDVAGDGKTWMRTKKVQRNERLDQLGLLRPVPVKTHVLTRLHA